MEDKVAHEKEYSKAKTGIILSIVTLIVIAAAIFFAIPWIIIGLVWLVKTSGLATYMDWVFQNFLF